MNVRQALLAILLAAVWMGSTPVHTALDAVSEAPTYRGRLLVDVLRDLQDQGLELIYSTAVVRPDMRITVEPRDADLREVLGALLEPLGLEATEGPGSTILIVARTSRGGVVEGRVLTRGRGLPVAGATIEIGAGVAQGLVSADGSFEVEDVPPGRYPIAIRAPGFWTVTLQDVQIVDGTPTELRVEMEGQPSFVAEVVVIPRLSIERHEQEPTRTIDNADIVLVPTVGGDVSRVIELLPGVSSSDNSAAFHVRGSSTDDVGVILDGLELYDPFHLKSFQSPFSLVDGAVVDRIDFMGGGFTADLGDRHGGFVQMDTLLPEDEVQREIELGSLSSRASFSWQNAPASRSWLVSARGWYPEAFRDTIELGGGERVDPRFGDAYAKVAFQVSPKTRVTAHTLLSYDRLQFMEAGDEDGPGESASALTRNGYGWVRMLNTSGDYQAETVVSGGRIDRQREGLSKPQDEFFTVDDERIVDFVGLKHGSAWQLSKAHLLKAGIELRWLDAKYRYSRVPQDAPQDASSLNFGESGTSLAVYAAHRTRVSARLATEFGLRWDRQTYTDDNQLSPRLNAVWQLAERTELRLGLGRFSQSQRIHELRVEEGETEYQKAEISKQIDLAFQHQFRNGLSFRADAYYREQTHLRTRYENLFEPLELFPETGADRVLVAPETARLRGAEFLLRGDANTPLTWWVSYALASAEDEIEGELVPRAWDQTHSVKFLVGRRWGSRWSLSLTGTGHTGWPTTPVSGVAIPQPDGSTELEPVIGARNTDRYNDYYRFDAKLVRSFDNRRGTLRLSFEVANLTDRRNACCVDELELSSRPDGGIDVERELDHWLGITPSFSVLWAF